MGPGCACCCQVSPPSSLASMTLKAVSGALNPHEACLHPRSRTHLGTTALGSPRVSSGPLQVDFPGPALGQYLSFDGQGR